MNMKKKVSFGRSERLIKISALTVAASIMITCVSCSAQKTEREQPADEGKENGEIIRDHSYPEHPAEALRAALEKDVKARELPLTVSEVKLITFDEWERPQIVVGFTENSDNLCVIDFTLKNTIFPEDSDDKWHRGYDNQSFTIAFKDPNNVQDMETLLTALIKYLSPDLSVDEARRLAINQDKTLETDGYSQPADVGGYQV
jgi:hypothetical protein